MIAARFYSCHLHNHIWHNLHFNFTHSNDYTFRFCIYIAFKPLANGILSSLNFASIELKFQSFFFGCERGRRGGGRWIVDGICGKFFTWYCDTELNKWLLEVKHWFPKLANCYNCSSRKMFVNWYVLFCVPHFRVNVYMYMSIASKSNSIDAFQHFNIPINRMIRLYWIGGRQIIPRDWIAVNYSHYQYKFHNL